MPFELAQIAAGLPFAASFATAATVRALRTGRRRTALNEALHELRRPLQALALALPSGDGSERGFDSSLRMAAAALERLDREINGEPPAARPMPIRAKPLIESAVARWSEPAALAGGSLRLRWLAGEPVLSGDACEIGQAVDNLIANAIEHGGPRVLVEAKEAGDRLRVAILDSGRPSRPSSCRESPGELVARLHGRSRRGHGLRVVRRTVAAHGGDFRFRRSDSGAEATLDLPLLAGGAQA